MGAKFNIRTDDTTHSVEQADTYVSSAFSDLFDGQSGTAIIAGGAQSSHYLADINVSSRPEYGAGTLVGLEHYIWVNDISQGNKSTAARLKTWKSKLSVGTNEGEVTPLHRDIFVSSCHADKNNIYKLEDFSGRPSDTEAITTANYTAHTTSYPYLSLDEAHRFQYTAFGDLSSEKLWARYGNTLPGTGEKVIYLEKDSWRIDQFMYKAANWRGEAKGTSMWDPDEPRWKRSTLMKSGLPHRNVLNTTFAETDSNVIPIGADETVFDRISSYWANTLNTDGDPLYLARASYSSEKTLDGGTSCKLRAFRQALDQDGTMNLSPPPTSPYGLDDVQHIKMEMDNFPSPVQVDGAYTHELAQIAGEFSMDIYIDKLNVCLDNDDSTDNGLGGETLNRRSLAFMWGEKKAGVDMSIYDYIKSMDEGSAWVGANFMGVFLANLSTVSGGAAAEAHNKNGIYCIPSTTGDPGRNWGAEVNEFYGVGKTLTAWSMDSDFTVPEETWVKFTFLFLGGKNEVRVYVTDSKSGDDYGDFSMRLKSGSVPGGKGWPRYFSIWLNNTYQAGTSYAVGTPDSNTSPSSQNDTESIVYIDNLTFKNFTPGMKNASNNEENMGHQEKIQILSDSGYTFRSAGRSSGDELYRAERLASNYISLGFENKDAAATGIDASEFHLLFSGYNSSNIVLNDPIINDEFKGALFGLSAASQYPLLGHNLGQLTFGTGNTLTRDNYPVTDGQISYAGADNAIDGFTQKGFLGVNVTAAQLARCEERENILFSSRVNKAIDSFTIEVDDLKPFRVPGDTVFRTYLYGGSSFSNADFIDSTVTAINGNEVSFSTAVGDWLRVLSSDDRARIWCGPKRFWLILKIYPVNSSLELLPARSYSSVISTTPGEGSPPDASKLGATWSESLFTDSKFYNNSWDLFPSETGSNLEVDNDYGYGKFDPEETVGGYVQQFYPEDDTYNKIDLSAMVEVDKLEPEDKTTLLISSYSPSIDHAVSIHTTQGTNIPFTLSVFEDELPERPRLEVEPSDIDPMYPKFTWDATEDDLWYGLLHFGTELANNQYHKAVAHLPLNEGSITASYIKNYDYVAGTTANVVISDAPTVSYEGLAGYAIHFANSADQLTFTTSNDPTDKATYLMHVTPTGAVGKLLTDATPGTGAIEIEALTNWQIKAQVRPSGFSDSVVLKSSTQLPTDIPACIIVTVDTTEKANNVKLFINGKLEDQTGVADSTGPTPKSTEHWKIDTDITTGGTYSLGRPGTGSGALCKMEEVVIYNTIVYPVCPRDQEFTLIKNFKELVDDTTGSSLSYSARLFIKDYHNIRGKTVNEVASSSALALRKPAPKIVGSN